MNLWRIRCSTLICGLLFAAIEARGAGTEINSDSNALRISTEDPCVLLQMKTNALLQIRATRIHCDQTPPCAESNTFIPVPSKRVEHGGVVLKASIVRGEMEKRLSGLPLEMANVLISVSICENKDGKCGKESAQLLKLKGNYFEALETDGKLPIELWVDSRRLANVNASECPN